MSNYCRSPLTQGLLTQNNAIKRRTEDFQFLNFDPKFPPKFFSIRKSGSVQKVEEKLIPLKLGMPGESSIKISYFFEAFEVFEFC